MRRHRGNLVLAVVAVIAALTAQLGLIRPVHAAAGTFVQYTYSGPAGTRPYYVYTPAGYSPSQSVPLIVLLHGCTQNPVDFSRGTQMNPLADSKQFIVVYPQQTTAYEPQGCWHWDQAADQSRGTAEPAIIAGITQTVMANSAQWNIDPNRVYVTGLSAGAAMSVVMGATYPDLYAAMGEAAGLEYKAATNGNNGPPRANGGPNPVTQGQAAYGAMGPYARRVPVIVFHGTQDTIVYPINGDQVVQQWMETDLLASSNYNPAFGAPSTTVNGQVAGGRAYTVRSWNDLAGSEVEEYWTISGMGHAWSGGSTTGSFTDPLGPNASQNMYAFFMAHPLAAATVPPTAPGGLSASSTASTKINLSWTASSGATSYQVQRSLDGVTGWGLAGSTSATSYTDSGLTPSTTYAYQVIATNAIGSSGPSNIASAMTELAVSQAPQGSWRATYGADGYALLGWNGSSGDLVLMGPATLTLDRATRFSWRTGSTQVRDLQSPDGTTRRATCVFDTTRLALHLTFANAYTGTLHLYALDASTNARRQIVSIDDGSGPRKATLSSAFDQGLWINAPINVAAGGTVTVTADHTAGYNAVLSGLFLN